MSSSSSSAPPIPFSSLPLHKSPTSARLNAWGLYGDSDELGFLNRQTPDLIAAAASSEIRTGTRIPLDAPLDFQGDLPLFGRQIFHKHVYQKKPRIVHDDTWSFNTQSSSQWDGLRHFGYQKAERFYNDTTVEDIAGSGPKGTKNPNVLGIQNVVEQGGIMGRGILVDFRRWIEEGPGREVVAGAGNHNGDGSNGKTGFKFSSFESTPIKFEWLLETLKWQDNTVPKYGDILIVRSGFFKSYYNATKEQLQMLAEQHPPSLGGVEQSDEVLKWIWDNFSAVASDHPSFERWPSPLDWSMHEVLLAGWGCHIGELLDLEALSRECKRLGRWSFFVASVPCYVPGGVASPVNGVAIF